ncbi:hypothetical protein G6M12_19450 [Agrobacterium tumefaciens]|nr:hypothetical protein [Agrobacterium tumefaciens]
MSHRRIPLPVNITDKIIALTNAPKIKELSEIFAVIWFEGLTEQDHEDIRVIAPASMKIKTLYADITEGVVTRRTLGKVDWQEGDNAHIYAVPKVYIPRPDKQSELLDWIFGDVAVFSRHSTRAPMIGKGLAWDGTKQKTITRDIRPTDKVMTHSGGIIYAQHLLKDRGDSDVVLIPASFHNRHLPKIENSKTKADYVLTQATTWIIHDGTIIAHIEDHKTTRTPHPNVRPLYLRTVKTPKRRGNQCYDVHLTDIEEGNKPANIFQFFVNPTELKLLTKQKNKRGFGLPYVLDHLTTVVGIDAFRPKIITTD